LRFLRSLKPQRRTLIGGLVIGIGMTLLMLLVLQGLPIFTRAELSAYDWQMNRRGTIAHPDQIVVLGVDAGSDTALPPGTTPPRRYWIGQAVDFLCRAHARAIGIDFSYYSPSVYDVFTKNADTLALAAALKRCHNVVLNEQWESPGASSYIAGTALAVPVDPLPSLSHLGVSNVPLDSDNVIRQAWNLQSGTIGMTQPTFPAVLASIAEHKTVKQVLAGLPRQMLINYVGPQDPGGERQSWYTAQFAGAALREDSESVFSNKIVLIVPAADVFADTHTTPFGDMFGGYIQANALNTILERNPIVPAGDGINNLVIILIGLLTAVIASRFGIWRSLIAAGVIAIGFPIVTILAFSGHRYWLNLATPELTLVLVLAAIMAFRFATEERQKRRAHQKFGLYLKPEIVEILVNSPEEDTTLQGVRRPISVLFVDIRGFTAMSERMKPEDVVSLLDIYLEELTDSVQKFDGTLDKYVGDELMAVWNAPRLQADHAMLAVKTALEMVNRLDKINAQLTARHLPNIKYGIGVNTGDGIVGEMGSTFRKQYDAIGDSVNTGARLCSAAGGAEIIIGQATWEILGDQLEVEETESLHLKGKSERLRTFRVIGIRETPLVAADVVEAAAAPA
jgi:adenylate cyclase